MFIYRLNGVTNSAYRRQTLTKQGITNDLNGGFGVVVHVVPASIDDDVQVLQNGSIGGEISVVHKHAESVAIVRHIVRNPQFGRGSV